MYKISTFIIARDNANSIDLAINSVNNITTEIIVLDTGSVDDTVKIAQNLGAKVIFNDLVSPQECIQKHCKNDWILHICANEQLSIELQDEIEYIFASDNQDKYLAYEMKIVSDKKMRLFNLHINKCIRLYNRLNSSFYGNNLLRNAKTMIFNECIDWVDKIYTLNGVAYLRN